MTRQHLLFDRPARRAVQQAAESGQERARAGTPRTVREVLADAIHVAARSLQEFTAEDVWDLAPEVDGLGSYDGRVLGALLRDAQRAGLIQPTPLWRASTRVACHGRPMRVWRATR